MRLLESATRADFRDIDAFNTHIAAHLKACAPSSFAYIGQ